MACSQEENVLNTTTRCRSQNRPIVAVNLTRVAPRLEM